MGNIKATEIATIDVVLVTVEEDVEGADVYMLDTASQIQVEPIIETQDSVPLIIKGVLKAQKPAEDTLTGHNITLTDNVFTPELVKMMQGGTIKYDAVDTEKIIGYTPPVTGTKPVIKNFITKAYSAQYNAAGEILQYERITYPHCKGRPVAFGAEDGAFRVNEYTIQSRPDNGEAPYDIDYVAALPVVTP